MKYSEMSNLIILRIDIKMKGEKRKNSFEDLEETRDQTFSRYNPFNIETKIQIGRIADLYKIKTTFKYKLNFAVILASNSIALSSLSYPSGMASTGIVLFTLLLALALGINYMSGYFLVYCAQKKQAKSYSHLTEMMLGKYKAVVEFFYLVANFGIILSGVLTFNDFMTGIFQKGQFKEKVLITSKKSLFWIVLPNLFLFPILLRENIKDVKYISFTAVIAVILLSFYSVYIFFEKEQVNWRELNYFNISESGNVLTLLLFGYMNQQNIIDVFNEL